jgi:hypothetical protein
MEQDDTLGVDLGDTNVSKSQMDYLVNRFIL